MSNIKVSSDIDEILRKSTKAEVNAFLGVNTIKSNTDTNTANVATNTADIATNSTDIATNASDIATNSTDIATNAADIATNTSDIATNTSAIATNTSGVATNASNIATNASGISTNASNIATNTADIATNTSDISDNAQSISDNSSDIATANTAIDTKAPKASPIFTGTATFDNDVIIDGEFALESKADFNGDVDISGSTEFQNDITVINGGIELQDTGLEISGDGDIELTDQGKIKVGSDLEITKDTIDFDGVEVIAVEERFLSDENGEEAFTFVDRTELKFGEDGNTTTKVGIRKSTPSCPLDVDGLIKSSSLETTSATVKQDLDVERTLTVFGDSGLEGNVEVEGKITMPTVNKALTKNNCYNKTGAVRLQKSNSDADEMIMRYEGVNSNNFVIEQYKDHDSSLTGQATTHGRLGQIKFIGVLPNTHENAGENCISLNSDNINVGSSNTSLTKIHSDTNISANKKLAFTDTRDSADGLQFYHTGVRPNTSGEAGRDAIQMGMYGSYGDSNIGEFKITHKIGTASNTDVLSISPTADKVKIHKPLNLGNVPVFADNTAASSLATGDVYRTSTGVLMIKY